MAAGSAVRVLASDVSIDHRGQRAAPWYSAANK
jgi:hypothetical protein